MPQHQIDDHARLGDLSQGEHMLLWAFRATAFGAGDCRLMPRQLVENFGPQGQEALTALTVFVRELGLNGRRRITLAAPGSYRLTRDEQSVLALFASAQAEDYARLEAHLAWLLADTPRAPFPAAACLVAQALAMNGLMLRLPTVEAAHMSAAPQADDEADDQAGVVTPFRRRAS